VVEGLLTGGNVADITVADDLTADLVGCYVVEDRGYDIAKTVKISIFSVTGIERV